MQEKSESQACTPSEAIVNSADTFAEGRAANAQESNVLSADTDRLSLGRRKWLLGALGAVAGVAAPMIWVPRQVRAQTMATGAIKHLIYVRLSGGFRFPCAYNGDVGEGFNPYGLAAGVPSGVSWGVSKLLEGAPWAGGTQNGNMNGGMAGPVLQPLHTLADKITVMPTVDHEPLAGGADGNHDTGLERYLTGYVNGDAGFFTRIQMGLGKQYDEALKSGGIKLPAFVMGSSAMARGLGEFAAHRPPVLNGSSFDRFRSSAATLPDWVNDMVAGTDTRARDRKHKALRDRVDAYIQTRAATKQYSEIFMSQLLKVNERSTEIVDGVSNDELRAVFGDSGSSANVRLALRLFHYGCPAVYLDQGGYDYHSGERDALPRAMEEPNRIMSGLMNVLPRMEHPDGGTYWDHTVIAFGSEFSRTARGSKFNSANGSDHNGDYSTRYMSMPFFGGPIVGGRVVGATTSREDMAPSGTVYSYRAMLNTLMDGLGCDSAAFFPGDSVVPDLLGTP
jgi:hypothetical protein